MSHLSAPHFHNEEAAYAYVEARVWPNGPVCPHCGGVDRISKMEGKSTRIGTYKCYQCRKPFTVKVGTIFEASHVPMHVWLQAIYLMCASKKGISSNQLHRTLGVTLKTAWFMSHRIREAMRSGDLAPFGSDGGIVEVDETFIGNDGKPKPTNARGCAPQEQGAFADRSRHRPRPQPSWWTISRRKPCCRSCATNIAREARVMTDEARLLRPARRRRSPSHDFVSHGAGEYVRGEVHTNTLEGFFCIFKRGMRGIYQHCDKKHLHRYMAEFDFRYSNRVGAGADDAERADRALKGIVGKRLTYRTTGI